MAYTKKEITTVHKDYEDNKSQWSYYIRSFLGGVDYKLGSYLHRYSLELDLEYSKRISNTPLDNHCHNVIQIYSSFLFRQSPSREMGTLQDEPSLEFFMKDCDLDGNTFESQIRQAQIYASVYGLCLTNHQLI